MRTDKQKKTGQKGRPGGSSPRGAAPQGRVSARRALPWLLGVAGFALLVALAAYYLPRASGPVRQGTEAAARPEISGSNALTVTGTNLSAQTSERQKEALVADLNTTANSQLRAGDAAGAARTYQQAIALTPNDEDLHFNLGIAYARLGDLTNAEKEYNEALRLLPDYPEVHNNLGNLLMRQGRMAEAETHFTEAIKQMPEYAQAYNSLGVLRQRQRMTNEALACFQKAVQYETNYWEGHFNLANAYLSVNERDKGIAELRETLRINPGFEMAQRVLAKMLSQASNAAPSTPPASTR